jgi:hypothetical protein
VNSVTSKLVGEQPKSRPTPSKLKFIYNKNEDLQPIYINGVIGGISPKGELICHFYLEYKDLPLEDKVPLVEGIPQIDKTVRKERIDTEEGELVIRRDIKTTVIIPAQEINNVINWMSLKLKDSNIIIEKE